MATRANANLGAARKAKQDEFYTQWGEIEREINAYLEYDSDAFRGKTVLLPCDDPEWSNFTKFFALRFADLGLKKLISTSYAPNSNAGASFYEPTLFETEYPGYDPEKSLERGRIFTLTSDDISGDGRIDIDDLHWDYLAGDGDFRSPEVTALRGEADVVMTNPPFSLFRPFLAWLMEGAVQFSIIGNMNASKYKEVFPLFQENQLWYGPSITSGDREFRVPDSYPLNAAGSRVDDDGSKFIRVKGVRWFTNIDHGRRHEPLQLMTMADNIKFSRHKEVRGAEYQTYTNFDAIEIPYSDAIPSDYDGVMGVPISFLDKYSPDQFEILGTSLGLAPSMDGFAEKGTYPKGGPNFYLTNGDGTYRRTYERLAIRHRKD